MSFRRTIAFFVIVALLALVSTVTAASPTCCRTKATCADIDKKVDIICVRHVTRKEECVFQKLTVPKQCHYFRHFFGYADSPQSASKQCFVTEDCARSLGWYKHDIRYDDAWCYTRTNPGWEAARRWFEASPNC